MFVQVRRWRSLAPILVAVLALLALLSFASDVQANWKGNSVRISGSDGGLTADAAVDPTTGKVHIVWINNEDFNYYYNVCDPSTSPASCRANAVLLGGGSSAPIPAGTIDPEGATAQAWRPSVAVTSKGVIYVGYTSPANGTGKVAYYRKKTSDSAGFSQPVRLGGGWQVRIAVDSAGNLHAVWGNGGVVNYRKIKPDGTLFSPQQSNITGGGGYNPQIVTDSSGNAHIFWETGVTPREIQYREIMADGTTKGNILNISSNAYNSSNVMVARDELDQLHVVWQDVGVVRYRKCTTPLTSSAASCTRAEVKSGSNAGSDPSVTVVNTTPIVAYFTNVSSSRAVWINDTKVHQRIDSMANQWFPVIRSDSSGRLHLIYRLGSDSLRYWVQDSGIAGKTPTSTATSAPPTNTPTATSVGPTMTATVTPTATEFISPTPTSTPSPSRTPSGPPVPQNLTSDRAVERSPSVFKSNNGNIVVAWEQDIATQQDIFARVASNGGAFGARINVTKNKSRSRGPSLFGDANTSNVGVVFSDRASGGRAMQAISSVFNGSTWSAASLLAASPGGSVQDPAAVRTDDGKTWVVWRNSTGFIMDTYAQQIGGSTYHLSTGGVAGNHPAVAAGTGGQIFATWQDNGRDPEMRVKQWTGTTWVSLPNPRSTNQSLLPDIAYHNGQVYVVWQENKIRGSGLVLQRVWNGTSWGNTTTVSNGPTSKKPHIFIPASGNVFVVWSDAGRIYLSINSGPRILVSGKVTGADDPDLFVDNTDTAHIVFQNRDIWYVSYP